MNATQKTDARKSIWTAIASKRAGIVGYIEEFTNRTGDSFTIPGVSRWIDGPVFDQAKARLIAD